MLSWSSTHRVISFIFLWSLKLHKINVKQDLLQPFGKNSLFINVKEYINMEHYGMMKIALFFHDLLVISQKCIFLTYCNRVPLIMRYKSQIYFAFLCLCAVINSYKTLFTCSAPRSSIFCAQTFRLKPIILTNVSCWHTFRFCFEQFYYSLSKFNFFNLRWTF